MRADAVRAALRVALFFALGAPHVAAQGAPPTASFPEPEPSQSARPASAPTSAPLSPPVATPAPAAAPPAVAGTPATTVQSAPAPAEPPPPPLRPAAPSPPIYEPPPPPPAPPHRSLPDMSVRVDILNLLIDGKLSLELEAAVLKWMSVELVPVFVVNDSPPTFGYFGGPHGVRRESNGWGPLAGTSVDVGFWFGGKALQGDVLRLMLTNYSYAYRAPTDHVDHVERQLFLYFGSHSRWGAFTLTGGFGLGVELHKQRHCYLLNSATLTYTPSDQCDENGLLLRTDPANTPANFPASVIDLNGGLGGVQLLGRLSLGVVF